jgi:hypothetical protein
MPVPSASKPVSANASGKAMDGAVNSGRAAAGRAAGLTAADMGKESSIRLFFG